MKLGIPPGEIAQLTLPALQALFDEANLRRSRMLSRAKQAKAMGVIDYAALG
jgi:hypothetical protein